MPAIATALLTPSAIGRAQTELTSVVVAEGDSLTYGFDESASGRRPPVNGSSLGRSVSPYPDQLQKLLGPSVRVVQRGYPGDRSVDALARWRPMVGAAVAIIMFGTNDAFNYGNRAGGTRSPARFADSLRRIVVSWQERGTKVIVVAPPVLESKLYDAKLEPYRDKARVVASETGSSFVRLKRPGQSIWVDTVHLSPAGNGIMAAELAPVVRCLIRLRQRHAAPGDRGRRLTKAAPTSCKQQPLEQADRLWPD